MNALASNPTRDGATCGHSSCPNCGVRGLEFIVEATGATRRTLFDWQGGVGGPSAKPNGPRFSVEKDGHDEAEVRCRSCAGLFWTLSPTVLEDARRMNDGGQGQHPV